MNPPQEKLDVLKQDLHGAEAYRQSLSGVEKRISKQSASSEEILEWYLAQDPLEEQQILDVLAPLQELSVEKDSDEGEPITSAEKVERYRTRIKELKALTSFHSAEISAIHDSLNMAALYHGAAYNMLGNLWREKTGGVINADGQKQIKMLRGEGHDKKIATVLQGLPDLWDMDFDKDELTQIGTAGDMCLAGARYAAYSGEITDLDDRKFAPNTKMAEFAVMLYDLALNRSLEHLDDPEIAKLHMELLTRRTGYELSQEPLHSEETKKLLGQVIKYGVGLIANKSLDGIDAAHQKGFWHEVCWFVDFNILKQYLGLDYSILPASDFEDSPHLDHPEYRRGFDFRIGNERSCELVQLKSSKRAAKGKEYHPSISSIVETGFNTEDDVLISRLLKCLDYLNSDFDEAKGIKVVVGSLASVKAKVEQLIEDYLSGSNTSQIDRINALHEIVDPDSGPRKIAHAVMERAGIVRQEILDRKGQRRFAWKK